MEKRKTKTSSAVKNRYNAKTYKTVQTKLKKELVEKFEEKLESDGIGKAEFIRDAITDYLGDEKAGE
jgi:metal-responsive CopG/Arc/MetJ family transcriptional regulator